MPAKTKDVLQLTAILWGEGDGYVAICPALDSASQGSDVEAARSNLQEALALFFESAESSEFKSRLNGDLFVTRVEVAIG